MSNELFTMPDGTVVSMRNIDFIGEYQYSEEGFWTHMKSGNKVWCGRYRSSTHTYRSTEEVKNARTNLLKQWTDWLKKPTDDKSDKTKGV